MSHPHPFDLAHREGAERHGAIDGVDTHWWEYVAAPRARTIVLIHGFRGDHHGLELIADALAEFRILIPDIPAFGRSGAWNKSTITIDDYGRWLQSFLRATATTDDAVVGHSFGSIVVSNGLRGKRKAPVILINPISQRALHGPRRFASMIANSWYAFGGALPETLGNRWLSNPLFVRVMSNLLVKSDNRALRRYVHDQHSRYFSNYSNRSALISAYAASTSNDVSDYAADISCPVLLVVAADDDITPLDAQHRVAEQFPNAQLKILDDVGHLVHYERPLQTAQLIRDFLTAR